MNGYVENRTPVWVHAMKRSIGPGAKIPLNDLYNQYGIKHDLEKGEEFISWLKNVKLKDTDKWSVVYKGLKEEVETEVNEEQIDKNDIDSIDSIRKTRPPKRRDWVDQTPVKRVDITTYDDERSTQQEENDNINVAPNKLGVQDIVLLSVRKAREVIPSINDKKLLQYSLEEANTRPGKDSLCKIIRNRISQLETIVR
ncbi:MAG: hypothetical protein WCQ65_09945 [Fermentimonas sp.]